VLFAALGQSSQSSRLLMELDRTLWLSIQANDSMKEDLLSSTFRIFGFGRSSHDPENILVSNKLQRVIDGQDRPSERTS
jgi:hypothetical protein